VREFKIEKEAAIIDEDVNSEDAQSVGKTKSDTVTPSYQKKEKVTSKRFKTPRERTVTDYVKQKKHDKFEY
jgi:hypothetical protein